MTRARSPRGLGQLPLVTASRPKPGRVAVTVVLDPAIVALLDATATHLGKSRADTVADALRCMFVLLPRPDDAGQP